MNLAQEIIRLLDFWSHGEIDEQMVHESSEEMLKLLDWKELPRSNPLSASYEVIFQLSLLNQQWITPDDIPALKMFLNEVTEDAELAWETYEKYMNSIDFNARKVSLQGNPNYTA